jgi:hypothetical protein
VGLLGLCFPLEPFVQRGWVGDGDGLAGRDDGSTGAAGQLRASAPQRGDSAFPVCVVLHVDDHPVTQAQEMRPFVPRAVALRPGNDDRNAAVPLFDAIDA